ncbi:mediator complex subunit [Puttea exsequens]|nr:mediator complex subunit [Puttea exsequens]
MDSQAAIQDWGPDLLEDPTLGEISFQDSVLDNAPVSTRAGLYVYLDFSLASSRTTFEDDAEVDFFNTRYQQNATSIVSDLILASFDVLANAMYRNERLSNSTLTRSIFVIRSFIANKLPVFIRDNYATLIFEPNTVEQCLRDAFARIDPHALPTAAQEYDLLSGKSLLSEARTDLLFACALHGLIPEKSIEDILGDVPMQVLPASGVLRKEDLVSQFTESPGRIDQCVGELEKTDGNSGTIASAIIDTLQFFCANNETMATKVICNALCRKAQSLDIIMLFARPESLLLPLCNILDNWPEHEDQGEYQPVYDEFGSILLFVAVVSHRFKIQPDTIGLANQDSFVAKYFREGAVSRSIDDMPERENQMLGAWIKGLFEAESISDELMSTCKPSEFHLLVPTLFDQSLKASQANILALDTLRGGFEYLLEPFLHPSLVAGLIWFSHRLWEVNSESKNLDTLLSALSIILSPPQMTPENEAICHAVLSIVRESLVDALTHVVKQFPKHSSITPLKKRIDTNEELPIARRELASWATTPSGGLSAALRHTIQSLFLWSATTASSNDMSPPSYSSRQLSDSIRILGAPAVLQILIDEANNVTITNTDAALDIIVMMIYTSLPPSAITKRQLSLQDALHLEIQTIDDLARTDAARASTVVRLHRRIEDIAAPKTDSVGGGDGAMTGIEVSDGIRQPTNIDDVLGEAGEQLASAQEALYGSNTTLMGMA